MDRQVQFYDVRERRSFKGRPVLEFGYRATHPASSNSDVQKQEQRYTRGSTTNSLFARGYLDGSVVIWDYRNGGRQVSTSTSRCSVHPPGPASSSFAGAWLGIGISSSRGSESLAAAERRATMIADTDSWPAAARGVRSRSVIRRPASCFVFPAIGCGTCPGHSVLPPVGRVRVPSASPAIVLEREALC